MLYQILFVILSSSNCIFSKPDWENFVDRLDLLIRRSYLIIQCNDKEIQIIRIVKTFEELKSNMKCKNQDKLFKHKIDNVQIMDFSHATTICENKKVMLITGHFSRVEKSLDKIENGVDWPFLHTQFTKETSKSPPIKMKFFHKDEIDIRLFRIQMDELSKKKDTIFTYLDFVNRPMVCSIRLIGLTNKTQPSSCHTIIIDQIYSPLCFYKVSHLFKSNIHSISFTIKNKRILRTSSIKVLQIHLDEIFTQNCHHFIISVVYRSCFKGNIRSLYEFYLFLHQSEPFTDK